MLKKLEKLKRCYGSDEARKILKVISTKVVFADAKDEDTTLSDRPNL